MKKAVLSGCVPIFPKAEVQIGFLILALIYIRNIQFAW